MSLLNAWVGKTRAMIGVDTDSITPEGEHFDTSKLLILPHAGVVFAGRGDRLFVEALFQYFYRGTGTIRFDEVAEHLSNAIRAVIEHMRSLPGFSSEQDYQVVVAGWSEKLQRMSGYFAHGVFDVNATPAIDKLGQIVMPHDPWLDCLREIPTPKEPESHLILAAVQSKWLRQQGTAGGGRLVLAELTQDQVTVRTLSFQGTSSEEH